MSAKIKLKRGTTASWKDSTKDNTLASGELGIEYVDSTNARIKVGNSDTPTTYSNLNYLAPDIRVYQDGILKCGDNITLLFGNYNSSTGITSAQDMIIMNHSFQFGPNGTLIPIGHTNCKLGSLSSPFKYLYLGADPTTYTANNIEAAISYTGKVNNIVNTSVNMMQVTSASTAQRLPILDIGSSTANACFERVNIRANSNINIFSGTGSSYLSLSSDEIKNCHILTGSTSLTLYGSSNEYQKETLSASETAASSGVYQSDIVHSVSAYSSSEEIDRFEIHQTVPQYTFQSGTNLYTMTGNTDFYPVWEKVTDKILASLPSPNLGNLEHPWSGLYVNTIYDNRGRRWVTSTTGVNGSVGLGSGTNTSGSIVKSVNLSVLNASVRLDSDDLAFRPSPNSTSSSTGVTLGTSSFKWRYLYAYSGTIQTSDRSEKSDINYIDSVSSTGSQRKVAAKVASETIKTDDVIQFVKDLQPVTFCYKDGNEDATIENADPEMIQLGLIADDLVDSKLFKYVGVETEAKEVIEPEEIDENTGEVIKEAVTQTKTVRGLQAIPLATAALSTCKYLLNKIEALESEINALKNV